MRHRFLCVKGLVIGTLKKNLNTHQSAFLKVVFELLLHETGISSSFFLHFVND